MKVLSVRQPYAAFLVCTHPNRKNVENRTWPTPHRGWMYIHAAKAKVSKEEFEEAYELAHANGLLRPPHPDSLKYGGIIGMVKVTGCTRSCGSKWAFGPFIWTLACPYPLPFEPMQGQKGLWDYGTIPEPIRF